MSEPKGIFVLQDGTVIDAHAFPADAIVAKDGLTVAWNGGDWSAPEDTKLVDQPGAAIGWLLQKGKLVAPPEPEPPPAPVPPAISDRQFGQGLWHDGLISYADCEAFVSVGAIPKAMQDIIDTLADDDTGQPTPRKEATILVKGAKEYQRSNELVDVIRQAQGWTVEQLDDRWRAWGAL